MWLAGGGVQRNFRAAAEAKAEWRRNYRLRRELNGLRHPLELADGEVHLVPLFFLDAHEQQHEIGADREIRGIVGDDEGVEAVAGAARLERLRNQRDDVSAQRVHLAVELQAGHAVAEID